MDINTIYQIVGNLGVPMACLLGMFWLYQRQDARHAEESAKFTEAINNNTLAINTLIERLGK